MILEIGQSISEAKTVKIYLELDETGDIWIKATNGETKADIGYIGKTGNFYRYGFNNSSLRDLGFLTDDGGIELR
jgi:hypothetical protein